MGSSWFIHIVTSLNSPNPQISTFFPTTGLHSWSATHLLLEPLLGHVGCTPFLTA